MIADIRQYLEARPFEPITIVTTGGNKYPVATRDHISVNPQRTRVVIYFDDGSHVAVSALHIGSIKQGTPAA